MADINYYSIADQDGVEVVGLELPPPPIKPTDYSDILKLSHATNIIVKDCQIAGGKEDCIDMNRYCENVLVENTKLFSCGTYCMTIKGGTKNITIRNVEIEAHGSETDIDLGNWSDQSDDLTTNITLENVTSKDGQPVRVRVLWADPPTVIGGNVKVCVVPKWMVKIYRLLKKLHIIP